VRMRQTRMLPPATESPAGLKCLISSLADEGIAQVGF
jgi:hypothetical protein